VPSVIDLNAVVRDVEQMLRRVLPPTVNIVTSLDAELRAVFADTGQVEQVLMNLVVNARDAMADGGTLTIATANATERSVVSAAGADPALASGVMLSVSDTGCGMSREVQDRIFEPFFTTKDVGKGTGLGLSTAHGIVTQSGGRLSVSSTEGVGTTFTIHLPAAVEAIADSDAAKPEEQATRKHGSGFVLLVDDDVAVRYVAKRILESSGYTVLIATDGPEALLLHSQYRNQIDLVITDMIMPTMTGAVVAAALRAEDPRLPVILMSGAADDAMPSALDGEPFTILRKPFTPDAFIRTAAEALRVSSLLQR
jgi:CheY-like chemotaxis protein